MFNILNTIIKKNNKNHLTMILVLLTLLIIFPSNISAKMSDYSKFDWDKYYEAHKFQFGEICSQEDKDEEGNCKEDSLLKGQKRFFVRTYKLLAKYQKKGLVISDDLILTTAIYGLAGEHTGMPEGDQDYKDTLYNKKEGELQAGLVYDETIDDDEYEVDEKFDEEEALNLSKESDTIVTLIKNSIAYSTYCYGIYGDPEEHYKDDGSKYYVCPKGGTVTKIISHKGIDKTQSKCAVNISADTGSTGYELGFWTYYASRMNHDSLLGTTLKFFGVEMKDEKYDECMEKSGEYPEGTFYQYVDQNDKRDKHISNKKYFDFLKENPYFDKKPHLQDDYSYILKDAKVDCMTSNICDNSLEAAGKYEEYQKDIEEVRLSIIRHIIDTLNQNGIPMSYEGYGNQEYSDVSYDTNDRASFYWPIGGEVVEEREVTIKENNEDVKTKLLFADGTPKYTLDDVISYYGERNNPVTGDKEMHYGIDIGADVGTNIIAAFDGVVTTAKSGCLSGEYECNEGYGNYVIISHKNGDYTVYAHLSSIDSQISTGSTVLRGELIGKSGDTGMTKKPDLHYELRTGGNSVSSAVDPISNTSAGKNNPPKPEDLRPIGRGAGSELASRSPKFDGTHFTIYEFANKVKTYCASHSGIARAMCNDPEAVYESSRTYNVNPELVVTRAMAEGNSPGGATNNYWGYGCTNSGKGKDCWSFPSMDAGIKQFAKSAANKNTLAEWQGVYSHIGRYWYNPGDPGGGGCYYYPHLKSFLSPQRADEVAAICAKPTTCKIEGGDCTPTIPEDQTAYTSWQVEKNLKHKFQIVFGT